MWSSEPTLESHGRPVLNIWSTMAPKVLSHSPLWFRTLKSPPSSPPPHSSVLYRAQGETGLLRKGDYVVWLWGHDGETHTELMEPWPVQLHTWGHFPLLENVKKLLTKGGGESFEDSRQYTDADKKWKSAAENESIFPEGLKSIACQLKQSIQKAFFSNLTYLLLRF